mmetsp:Transcript_112630/g.199624  ORF Transcript_112630/g.199624 Transcript_112630/m.199624 type:complete len:133 (+) Transcript_112630:623-1021(+)
MYSRKAHFFDLDSLLGRRLHDFADHSMCCLSHAVLQQRGRKRSHVARLAGMVSFGSPRSRRASEPDIGTRRVEPPGADRLWTSSRGLCPGEAAPNQGSSPEALPAREAQSLPVKPFSCHGDIDFYMALKLNV